MASLREPADECDAPGGGWDAIPAEFDTETGLYYYRARYYDPVIGRFLSEDPARFRAGADFYPYVSNSPSNATDPFGLCRITVYFERLPQTLYIGIHAFIVVSDNTRRYRVPLPDLEYRGGPSRDRPETVVVDVGPLTQQQSRDHPSDASSSMEVLKQRLSLRGLLAQVHACSQSNK